MLFLANTVSSVLIAKKPTPAAFSKEEEPGRSHWAFSKPTRTSPPQVQDSCWIRTPVDAFILAKLEQAGLVPGPPADKTTLLRRITFDLTGLPPTPEDLKAYLADQRPDAYARVVERLLASPHYGERWAQHWLDVARYAESNGYELDAERPHAWHYRDYVIRSWNEDKPYDQFLIEQLAGDLLPNHGSGITGQGSEDGLIATGFNRCGPIHLVAGNTDPEVNRQEVLTEMTGAVGSVFLGLTIGCARCHDHKFDPVTQVDYYQLQAFFAAARPAEVDIATADERKAYTQRSQEIQKKLAPLKKQLADLEQPYKTTLTEIKKALLEPMYRDALDVEPAKRTPEQKKLAEQAQILIKVTWDEILEALTQADRARRAGWRAQIQALETLMPPPPAHAWAIQDENLVPATFVLKRGDTKRKGREVAAAFPAVLAETLPKDAHAAAKPARLDRLALARWLVRPDHPLTARVLVNRLWQHHFGRGLVATPNDFGLRGERPTHPELLDWLAGQLIEQGWSIKHMHRLMVLSSTYQQSSRVDAHARGRSIDPDNRLLWCMNRYRIEGEVLRDSVLAANGRLNHRLGGPMIRVPLEPEVMELIFTEGEPDGLWHVTPDLHEHHRRSIYLFAKRNVRLPLLESFDQPDSLTSCPIRPVSTFAPQALILLNGLFMQEQSKALAVQLLAECGSDLDRQVVRAYERALSRPPRVVELQMAREFLSNQTALHRERIVGGQRSTVPAGKAGGGPAAAAALADFCLALFNRNEFVYVD
jgi:hypothetical protein